MTDPKPATNLRQVKHWQKEAARAEYLRHPDRSIAEVAKATGVAVRTVARAREQLVKEGLLAPGRNATVSAADAVVLAMAAKQVGTRPVGAETDLDAPDDPPATPRGSEAATVDGEALRSMNELLDALADEDDDTTRKQMLRQVKRFAFDPNLHPDTRMSASTLWAKLQDMQRQKDIGPGVPMTIAAALSRGKDFLFALGVKLAVRALFMAFTTEQVLGEVNRIFAEVPNAEQPSTEAVEQSQPAPAPAGPAGPADDNPAPAN